MISAAAQGSEWLLIKLAKEDASEPSASREEKTMLKGESLLTRKFLE